jgi:hypothetical protein
MTKLLTIIALCATLTGCAAKATTQTTSQPAATQAATATARKTVHYCNARTRKNTPCHHRVKNEGDRCPLHEGREAIPENWMMRDCTTDADCALAEKERDAKIKAFDAKKKS